MGVLELSAISIALGMDAFGVALSLGLDKRITKHIAFLAVLSFGFFQFFFVFLGGLSGNLFNRYIFTMPHIVGGSIILFVGILMIKEGLAKENTIPNIHLLLIITLGICVSIDALVVGFSTFNIFYFKKILLRNSIVVGGITAFLTGLSFLASKQLRQFPIIKEYSGLLGGIILILFALKMIIF